MFIIRSDDQYSLDHPEPCTQVQGPISIWERYFRIIIKRSWDRLTHLMGFQILVRGIYILNEYIYWLYIKWYRLLEATYHVPFLAQFGRTHSYNYAVWGWKRVLLWRVLNIFCSDALRPFSEPILTYHQWVLWDSRLGGSITTSPSGQWVRYIGWE